MIASSEETQGRGNELLDTGERLEWDVDLLRPNNVELHPDFINNLQGEFSAKYLHPKWELVNAWYSFHSLAKLSTPKHSVKLVFRHPNRVEMIKHPIPPDLQSQYMQGFVLPSLDPFIKQETFEALSVDHLQIVSGLHLTSPVTAELKSVDLPKSSTSGRQTFIGNIFPFIRGYDRFLQTGIGEVTLHFK